MPDSQSSSEAELFARIESLRAELEQFRGRAPQPAGDRLETVSVPEQFEQIFLKAQQQVASYFADRIENPAQSTILISGERYILVRAASMSVEFFDIVSSLYRDRGAEQARSAASNLLFDIAHAIGKADACTFHERLGLRDPVEKLSAGPVHFSYSGWAFVKISPESRPSPDENYYLIYDHPFSFESDAWVKRGKRSDFPVCVMNAGYSSGWCEESFGLPLVASEVECLATGGEQCRFIMAPPSRIEEHIDAYTKAKGHSSSRHLISSASIAIPEFFQRKRLEDELRRSNDQLEEKVHQRTAEIMAANQRLRLFESAVENANEGIILFNAEGSPRVLFANSGFEKLTGYSAAEAVGQSLDILHISAEEDALERLGRDLGRESAFEGEAMAFRSDGSRYVLELHAMPIFDLQGRLAHWVCILRDVSDRKAQLAALEHQALHDVLTDLPNRVLLLDRMEQAILGSARQDSTLALLIMDLDRFKEVNDTLGHHMGDQVLMQIGPRLRTQLRVSDTVARLGGDEFAILLPAVADVEAALAIGRKLLHALVAPMTVDEHVFDIGASVGIAVSQGDGCDAATLLRRADVAMYIAKQSNSGLAVYSPEQDLNTPTRLAMVSELRQAIEQNQLALHYQPKVDLEEGTVAQVEALVRWQHPQQGLLMPDHFIPIAERTGIIGALTTWVINEALRQYGEWKRAGFLLSVAVNLSGRSLQDTTLVETIRQLLERWDVPPSCLRFELTESSIMADSDHGMTIFKRLRAMGVLLSIDDFGTGYSSLSHLRLLPVDEIKIDKSFVLDMLDNPSDEAIVRSTIQLCHNLGCTVIAEGVENEATLGRLRALGCDLAQGFHIARPMPGGEIVPWIVSRSERQS